MKIQYNIEFETSLSNNTSKHSLQGSRLQWARHIQRISEEILTKRARKTKEGGRRRRGRPRLRWRDSGKRDLERTELNNRKWEGMADDHDGWR